MASADTRVLIVGRAREAFACVALLTAALALDVPRAGAQIPSADSLKKVLIHATYVFEGVIRRWNAVADTTLGVNPRHAIVRASRVFSCPVSVGNFGNEDLTIRFSNPDAAPAGTSAWFLGTGWVIGDHIATTVLSVIPTKSPAQSDSVFANLQAATHLSARDALRAEAFASDSIVIGSVGGIGPPRSWAAEPKSEFAYEWEVVRLTVDSVRGIERGGSGRAPTFSVGWLVPPASARSMTVLVAARTPLDTAAASYIARNDTRLFLLDHISRQPNLLNIDSTAIAFVPSRLNIRDVGDASMLGDALPNALRISPVHPCGAPVR